MKGDSVLLCLFSLPHPTLKTKTTTTNPYSLQDVSNSFVDDIGIFASSIFCETVSHSDIVQPLSFLSGPFPAPSKQFTSPLVF